MALETNGRGGAGPIEYVHGGKHSVYDMQWTPYSPSLLPASILLHTAVKWHPTIST